MSYNGNNSTFSAIRKITFHCPFQDPSVQRAAGGTAPATNANLDDYNPFDKTKASTNNAAGDTTAAVMDTAPPQYTASGQQQVSAADFQVMLGRIYTALFRPLQIQCTIIKARKGNHSLNNISPLPSYLLSLPATYFSPGPVQELQVHTTDTISPISCPIPVAPKGPSIYDVRKILGFFDPLPPLVRIWDHRHSSKADRAKRLPAYCLNSD